MALVGAGDQPHWRALIRIGPMPWRNCSTCASAPRRHGPGCPVSGRRWTGSAAYGAEQQVHSVPGRIDVQPKLPTCEGNPSPNSSRYGSLIASPSTTTSSGLATAALLSIAALSLDKAVRKPGPVRRGRISETLSRIFSRAVLFQISETVSRKLQPRGMRGRSASCSPGCPAEPPPGAGSQIDRRSRHQLLTITGPALAVLLGFNDPAADLPITGPHQRIDTARRSPASRIQQSHDAAVNADIDWPPGSTASSETRAPG